MKRMTPRDRGMTVAAVLGGVMLAAGPAWATVPLNLPGPGIVGLVGAAVVGVILAARFWHKK